MWREGAFSSFVFQYDVWMHDINSRDSFDSRVKQLQDAHDYMLARHGFKLL